MPKKNVHPSLHRKHSAAKAKVSRLKAQLSAATSTANALGRAVGVTPAKKKRRKKSSKKRGGKKRSKKRRDETMRPRRNPYSFKDLGFGGSGNRYSMRELGLR